ncbi:MAG: hydantoinase/oxoprolinase family protein, partial [Pseudomonadota bacterium]|nr:hydantoinase/oxoprolinase family protein [Pseudomonadota bacterium]
IVLERKGAHTGLMTTRGFADVLEIGRQMRTNIYELELDPETPVFLAPGARRVEIDERVSADGVIIEPLQEDSVRTAVRALVDEGVTSIAVCLLFSFLNPAHERRVREIIEQEQPGITVSLSCEVDPAFREYERTVVTAFDAYIKPVLGEYLARLTKELSRAGVSAPLQVMQSRGGVSAAGTAIERPVRLFLSGPAAGVIGGSESGSAVDLSDLITVDIGGTSCDIALVSGGRPVLRPDGRIDGYPVRVPMVDVNAIGAGGGSIAWLDTASGIRVGPHSAGADPGPACYGRGGKKATVTDAAVVLGFLNPAFFAGGSVPLDYTLAEEVIRETIALPLAMSVEQAALGIHQVVNTQMAEGMRLVSVRQGHDPRDFALVALGGAGPVHAIPLAKELSISKVVVPRHPGVLSAEGLLAAPIEHEVSVGFPRSLKELTVGQVTEVLDQLDRQCSRLMTAEVVPVDDITISHVADVCYVGQSHYLDILLDLDEPEFIESIYRGFIRAHEQVFGYSTESPARIVNLRSVHRALNGSVVGASAFHPGVGERVKMKRSVIFDEGKKEKVTVYDRQMLPIDHTVEGPAIIEQPDTTTVLYPAWCAMVCHSGELVLQKSGAAE